MKNTVLAKRYAKALFAVGKEENTLDAFSQNLVDMAQAYTDCPELIDGLTNPLYPLDVRQKVMDYLIGALNASKLMTNFMNLLDLCGVAVPSGFYANGLPAGVTFIARSFAERMLCRVGSDFHGKLGLPLGATPHRITSAVS